MSKERVIMAELKSTYSAGNHLPLLHVLKKIVTTDDYYAVKVVTEKFAEFYDELVPRWLNSLWVGRALTRLGFRDKRRLGTGVQYPLAPKMVGDAIMRFECLSR